MTRSKTPKHTNAVATDAFSNAGDLSALQELFPYRVRVSKRFVVLSLLSSMLVAFAVGRMARVALVIKPQMTLLLEQQGFLKPNQKVNLPTPVLKNKVVPKTSYTSKNFDTAKSATINSRWVVTEEGKSQCVGDAENGECTASSLFDPSDTSVGTLGEEDDDPHYPQGQHLLIDIENVDGLFLNSEEQLANKMLELINECGLTLLSYHCHSLFPIGVSCAGVLLESHVSFHTWPAEGVITLDLFTCGPKSLLPIVPLAKKLFSVRSHEVDSPEPQVVWAHKYRGFSEEERNDAAEMTDFFNFPLGVMTDYKQEIATVDTKFQRVDIYDVLRPHYQNLESYHRSLSNDGSYEASNAELFAPDRIVFLDGVLQSRRFGDAAYHEALVHPGTFAHENPRIVAIIGGGEGATLREVLKHKTVEKVFMIEIDESMVQTSRKYLPDWSDCSRIKGSAKSCFDDPRVEIYYEDAFAWFINRYGTPSEGTFDPVDVLIMDALDPQVQKEFVHALYDGGPFLQSIPNAISKEGVFVTQVGKAPSLKSPPEEHSLDRNRVNLIRSLIDLGFQSIRDYEESHGGFEDPWQFIIAFRQFHSKAGWFSSSSVLDLKIRERLFPSIEDGCTLLHFDGATMDGYKYPSKASEVVFCRRGEAPQDCKDGHGFDPKRQNLPLSTLEVKQSSLGKHAGRGVFAVTDIPRLSYIGLGELVDDVYMFPETHEVILKMSYDEIDLWSGQAEEYMFGYGHVYSEVGRHNVHVDPTFQCFINHACNGTNNVGHQMHITEATADPNVFPDEVRNRYLGRERVYNPAADRQVRYYSSGVPLRDIKAGEELFDNYLAMSGLGILGWQEDVIGLKAQCSGEDVGTITRYEQEAEKWELLRSKLLSKRGSFEQ